MRSLGELYHRSRLTVEDWPSPARGPMDGTSRPLSTATALAAITALSNSPTDPLFIECRLLAMDAEGIMTPAGDPFGIYFLMYDTDGLGWDDIHPLMQVWDQEAQSGVISLMKMPPLDGWFATFPLVGTC